MNRISGRESLRKVVTIQLSVINQVVIHLSQNEKFNSILNHFNIHGCQFHTFTFKNEYVNVSENFVLLSGENYFSEYNRRKINAEKKFNFK